MCTALLVLLQVLGFMSGQLCWLHKSRTERACTCPSPKGWCRACCGRSMCSCHRIVGLCGCCTLCVVARVVGGTRLCRLCLPRMGMMWDVSMFPSFRPAASIASCRLCACLRVGILNLACPCTRGEFCDVFGAEAGFSPGRCCATSLCSILCWY